MPDNTNLLLDDGTLGIASTAFYGCKGLSSIHLPSGLDYIDGSAFDGCCSLVDFTVPSNVTSIGIGILANCDNLLSITVENGNAYYDSRNSCNAIMDTETNKLIAGCKNTNIPDETTEISARAFQGCTGLTTIVIPYKVKSIDSEAFSGCSNLSNVKFGQNLKTIGNSTFAGCKEIVSLELPHSVHSIDYRTFYGCSKLMSVTIGRSCLNIGDEAFASCPMLTDVFCYATMAPSAQTNTFGTSISENTTLYVQSAAYDDYRGFAPWSSFRNIISIGNLPTSEVLSKQTDGYSTYCNTYAVDFTSTTTLKAYVASEFNSSTNELLLTRVYNVPAGEGLILKGNAGEYEIPYIETDLDYSNLLKGVTTATTISPTEGEYTNFILANGSHGIGFYTLSQTGEIAAGKAYLQLPTSSLATIGTRGIIIRFNDEEWNATGVDEVSSILSDNEEYYDTQGRRLSKGGLKKGIYIVCSAGGSKNGKKIIIR